VLFLLFFDTFDAVGEAFTFIGATSAEGAIFVGGGDALFIFGGAFSVMYADLAAFAIFIFGDAAKSAFGTASAELSAHFTKFAIEIISCDTISIIAIGAFAIVEAEIGIAACKVSRSHTSTAAGHAAFFFSTG
jgi:hypothetical protein